MVDVAVDTRGKGQNQGNAYDANGTGERGEHSAPHFGPQIVEGKRERREKGHGSLALLNCRDIFLSCLFLRIGVRIPHHQSILQTHNPGSIGLRQIGVVGHHNDQPVFCHFFEQLHDLYRGLTVQGAGWLVGQEDFRVVNQGPGYGHTLHLPTGELIWVFLGLVCQPHLRQGIHSPAAALRLGDAGEGQRQLHIGQHTLMGN